MPFQLYTIDSKLCIAYNSFVLLLEHTVNAYTWSTSLLSSGLLSPLLILYTVTAMAVITAYHTVIWR